MADEGGKKQLFRAKSLERLSSPERLDLLLEIVDRKSWVPLTAIALLVVGAIVWSVVAKIPINVEGRGILIRPRKIVEFQSPGPGRVVRLEVAVGDEVRKGQLLALIERPDLEEQLRLQKQKAAELAAQAMPSVAGPAGAEAGVVRRGPTLHDHLERSRRQARTLRDEREALLVEEASRLDAQDAVARELTTSLRSRLSAQRELLVEGLIVQAEVDAVEEELMDGLERLYEIETQRSALKSRQLEADQAYFDRLQKIAEWNFDLEQQVADVSREIARLQGQLEQESRVVSDHPGRLLELNTAAGAFVATAERLGAMEIIDPASLLSSVSYFQVKDGKRLRSKMEIQITPDTIERERYGSIRGVVRRVSSFPVSVEEAARVVGNDVLAENLIDAGYMIEVTADLERSPDDPEAYVWTSSNGPREVEVTSGTTIASRVAVERRRPIAFVIPLLKSAAGVE